MQRMRIRDEEEEKALQAAEGERGVGFSMWLGEDFASGPRSRFFNTKFSLFAPGAVGISRQIRPRPTLEPIKSRVFLMRSRVRLVTES